MEEETIKLLAEATRKSKIETDRENQKFLNHWLPKGYYLRQRMDQKIAIK